MPPKPKAPADPVIERVPLAQLRQYPDNPRKGDVPAIVASLRRRRQYKPLIVTGDNVILVGNHTALALAEIGADTALIMRALDENGEPLHSDDPAAAEIVLADNRIPDLGGYDDAALIDMLEALGTPDELAVGFTDDDLADLIAGMEGAGTYTITDPGPADAPPQPGVKGRDDYSSENLNQWENSGRRIVLFDLPLVQFVWVQDQMKQLADRWHLSANKDVLLQLLANEAGEAFPPDPNVPVTEEAAQ